MITVLRMTVLASFVCLFAATVAPADSECVDGRDCATGFCADGVCCESACDEGRCDVPGYLGLCIPTGGTDYCDADCNRDGTVTIAELSTGVLLAMGDRDIAECRLFDRDRNGRVTVAEIVAVVRQFLDGCV